MTTTISPEVIGKRRGNRVRYRNLSTGKWGKWMTLTPDHPDYIAPAESPAQRFVADDAPEITVPASGGRPPKGDDYDNATRDELRTWASVREIKGRGSMTKSELIAALRDDDRR